MTHPPLAHLLAALDLDPLATGLRIVRPRDVRPDPWEPTLYAPIADPDELAELATALAACYPEHHPLGLVRAMPPSATSAATAEVADLTALAARAETREIVAIYAPALAWRDNLRSFRTLTHIVAALRGEGGCPWDREQTHDSLKPYVLEEAYEVLEALDAGDSVALAEELGDLLLQIMLHAQLASERGQFSVDDIVGAISTKLVHRHPHVFGDAHARDAAEVAVRWEELKAAEGKVRESRLDGIPKGLPALARARELQLRATAAGFDWPVLKSVFDKVIEELGELRAAEDDAERRAELGDLFFSLANAARWLSLDPEEALRRANAKFAHRFREMERLAREVGQELTELAARDWDALWERVKAGEQRQGDATHAAST